MYRFSKIGLTAAAMALLVAAWGGAADESNDDLTGVGNNGSAIAGVCAPDHPDCVDTIIVNDGTPPDSSEPLFLDDEPTDGLTPRASSGLVIDGGLTISEALATEATGVLAVEGFYVSDGTSTRFCELLAESYPPKCAGESIVVHFFNTFEVESLQVADGVEWTDTEVTVFGQIRDGAFNVATSGGH